MKRRLLVLLILLFVAVGSATAQDFDGWSSHYEGGNLIAYAGANINYWFVGATGGLEVVISQFKAGDYVPLDITLGARGFANLYMWYRTGLGFGGYPYIGLHMGLKDLFTEEELAWLNNLDYYAGIGFGVQYVPFVDAWYGNSNIALMFASHSGINYFLNDNIALFIEEGYSYYYWVTTAGLLIKL